MQRHKLKLIALLVSLSIGLYGCASSPVQVGHVVEAPQLKEQKLPQVVLDTPTKPTGYYSQKILNALESH